MTEAGVSILRIIQLTEDTFAPIDILDYIYAVLHSPTYREKYKEFLKIDFPRVPYPINSEATEKLNEFYNETAALPISHPIFHWYLMNYGNIQIEYRDGGINLYKTDDQEPEPFTDDTIMIDEVDDLIDQAFDNQN